MANCKEQNPSQESSVRLVNQEIPSPFYGIRTLIILLTRHGNRTGFGGKGTFDNMLHMI